MQTTRGTPLTGEARPDPPDEAAELADPGRTRRCLALFAAVAATAYALDQLTKWLVVDRLSDRGPVDLIPHVLDLRLTRNSGAAFSIGTGSTIVFSVVALVVVVIVLRTATRLGSLAWSIALGLLLGGAVGNLTDRIVRAPGSLRGHVVDFIEFPHFPLFNIADSSICTSAGLIILLSILGRQLDGTRATSGRATCGDLTTPPDPSAGASADLSAPSDAHTPVDPTPMTDATPATDAETDPDPDPDPGAGRPQSAVPSDYRDPLTDPDFDFETPTGWEPPAQDRRPGE